MSTQAMITESSKQGLQFLDLKTQFAGIREEVVDAVIRVLDSQHFILGEEVQQFEHEIALRTNCQFAIGCASGSDALLLSLMALGVGPGDEVITTPFTFVATAGSIARLGATPVFVDIHPETYNINPSLIKTAISTRTKAIIPVHLFGLPADMDPILKIASDHNLAVIEDAAQSIGAKYYGRNIASIGTLGCLSFFPSKNLGGAGDGGMVTTNDSTLADKVRVLRTHGSRRKYEYDYLGMNSRLDALQAAILRVKLRHLDHWTDLRRANAEHYRNLIEERGLQNVVSLPYEPASLFHVYNQFVIRVQDRDELQKNLREQRVPTETYYPFPLHLQRPFISTSCSAGDCPVAEQACKQVVALPIYPELSMNQKERVIDAIAQFYKRSKLGA